VYSSHERFSPIKSFVRQLFLVAGRKKPREYGIVEKKKVGQV
jgi:hypothetical protein